MREFCNVKRSAVVDSRFIPKSSLRIGSPWLLGARTLRPRPSPRGRAPESPARSSDHSPRVGFMSETNMPVRFGLVGTGYWARELHAVGAAGHPDAELVGVWG